jgi:hypothetical protein
MSAKDSRDGPQVGRLTTRGQFQAVQDCLRLIGLKLLIFVDLADAPQEPTSMSPCAKRSAAPSGQPSTGSATDAVAQVCGLRRVDHPNDLQLHARRQHLELPTATPEQHRDLMYY